MICQTEKKDLPASQNACKLCTPMGACLAFKGIEGAMSILHGSQGCATYIRRYMISHFREPMDIASSNFSEQSAVFGGRENLHAAIRNVTAQYNPKLIGIATTCLAETIGDDIKMFLHEIQATDPQYGPGRSVEVVHVSTPSYVGTHAEGFHATIRAIVEQMTTPNGGKTELHQTQVNLMPGMLSPADLRYCKEVIEDFGLSHVMLVDFSESLDGPIGESYSLLPAGGTPLEAIRSSNRSAGSIEFSSVIDPNISAGKFLEENFDVPLHRMPVPIGIDASDKFFAALEKISGRPTPERHRMDRERLVDAYVDAHKHLIGKTAAVFGEEDLVIGVASFLLEIGLVPVLCASGAQSGRMKEALSQIAGPKADQINILEGADFATIQEKIEATKPDLLIGHSKGYKAARELDIPLVRVGFPIHDRIDGARQLHIGYRGTQQLFDRIVNTLIEQQQRQSEMGYWYM